MPVGPRILPRWRSIEHRVGPLIPSWVNKRPNRHPASLVLVALLARQNEAIAQVLTFL